MVKIGLLFAEAILDNRGSHRIGCHFVSDCKATPPRILTDVNRTIIE